MREYDAVYRYAFWAAAPKGSMTYAFTQGNFLLLLRTPPSPKPPGPYLSREAHIQASGPKSQSGGPNPNLKAQIPPYSQNPIFEAQILASRDLGLKTGIWASRLGYGP